MAILIHSIIDFNMSCVYISVLVFLCLGVMAAEVDLPDKIQNLQSKKWIKYTPVLLNFPWYISLYEHAIALNFEMGRNNPAVASYWNQALEL